MQLTREKGKSIVDFHFMDYPHATGVKKAVNFLSEKIFIARANGKVPVVVCVGTDRSTGDSLGPFTGTILKNNFQTDLSVLGTIDEPVHAVNLDQIFAKLNYKYKYGENGKFIIAVDAAIGKHGRSGFVHIKEGPLYPGSGIGKDLSPVGHINVLGVVLETEERDEEKICFSLGTVRLRRVLVMSKIIANIIAEADKKALVLKRATDAIDKIQMLI